MKLIFYISLLVVIIIGIDFIIRKGWISLWNGIFIAILLVLLVLMQKYIGKLEGALITLIPFIIFQFLIKTNKKIQNFYISKRTKFINWCNNNIYKFSPKNEKNK